MLFRTQYTMMELKDIIPPAPPLLLPDLSLQISPPSDSGSDLSHENAAARLFTKTHLDLGPNSGAGRRDLHRQNQIFGRATFKRAPKMAFGVRRNIRAPRMRWTTTLHAHFVHAVQLLGGHESSTIITQFISFFFLF